MLTLLTLSLALAFSAPDADLKATDTLEPVQAVQTVDMSKRLSSAELARIRAGSVPSNCEVFWVTDPVTGEVRCDAVICRNGLGGIPEILECSEFGL